MNWVDSTPSVRTSFEQFLFSNFGTQIDLSHSNTVALIGIAVIFFLFIKLFWTSAINR